MALKLDNSIPKVPYTKQLWFKVATNLCSFDFLSPQLAMLYKVNRCLARYSPRATTTKRPTNRAPKMSAWPGPNWPKMPNLVVFGQKILFFTGKIKSFVTHITENPHRRLVHIVFWSGIGQNVQKMAIFGPKWPKLQILDQIWPFLGQNPNFYGSK